MAIESRNPATEELIEAFEEHSGDALETQLDASQDRFRDWRRTSVDERAALLGALADVLDLKRDELAKIATEEMGKTIGQARAEVEKCAAGCRYYAQYASDHLNPEPVATDHSESRILHQPLGTVLAIMPWNFPYWQAIRCAAPAIASGNVLILKHASNVPRCALALEAAFQEAGFPDDVFRSVFLESARAQKLVEHSAVAAVSLTGSERAGSAVAATAGAALKKTVLELGGSDPFIVMPSADFASAVQTAVRARVQNNGQSCIAAKRFIVHADIYDAFVNTYTDQIRNLRIGDPMEEGVDLGPLALPSIRDGLKRQVQQSVEAGATLFFESEPRNGPGYWYPPVVLTDIPDDAPARGEELFGPVASMFRVESIDEAVTLANETDFGLGASAWTSDETEQDLFLEKLDAGMVFVNAMVASDPRLPFGGVKRSGYGRELNAYVIHEFVNFKTAGVA